MEIGYLIFGEDYGYIFSLHLVFFQKIGYNLKNMI